MWNSTHTKLKTINQQRPRPKSFLFSIIFQKSKVITSFLFQVFVPLHVNKGQWPKISHIAEKVYLSLNFGCFAGVILVSKLIGRIIKFWKMKTTSVLYSSINVLVIYVRLSSHRFNPAISFILFLFCF